MSEPPARARRVPLRHLLFAVLFLSGVIPLVVGSVLVVRGSRAAFEAQERLYLVSSANALSRELSESLAAARRQLALIGAGLGAPAGPADAGRRLRAPWVESFLGRAVADRGGDLLALRALGRDAAGPRIVVRELSQPTEDALDAAFVAARERGEPVFEFAVLPPSGEPAVALAVPVRDAGGETELVVEGLFRLGRLDEVFLDEAEANPGAGLFLIGAEGDVLWSRGITEEMRAGLLGSPVVRDFVRRPLTVSSQYTLAGGGRREEFLFRLSPVEETGWGVVVQRPLAGAFALVDALVWNTLVLIALLLGLSLASAAWVARRFSQPIQRLAETSHEIAAGNFGRRVEAGGLARELADLATDFNLMSGHVEGYVARLEAAAARNRELFIGSLRAFAAAIDAKDPYTRGHSERVAALARAIAGHLGLPEEVREKVWIGALLHDVGKIGVDDQVLKKGGALTAAEYEQIKAHPTIGAEILSPIEQLKEILPAVRWHHECWNGRGYPDGLSGEAIPLLARIVSVADTFDAVTTSRPYQEGYTLEFALETLTRNAGSRFDAKIVTAFLHAVERGEVAGIARPGKVRYDQAAEARVAGMH
jgi:putative nucleotidyltransferase with HDIG domain